MNKYEHGGDIYRNNIRLDFSSNINPFGIPDTAKEAVLCSFDKMARYADTEYENLRRKIAEHENVDFENVLCGNGASELIFAVVRAFMPKKALLISPSFSEYERALSGVGCDIEYFALSEENGFELMDDFLDFAEDIDMLFICNPNNPTGTLTDKGLMDKILEKCKKNNITAVIDECFMDFVTDGYSVRDSAVVIKAFTKIYAMAGLRLGYMLSDRDVIEKVKSVMIPWSVNAAAEAAGIAALCDREYRKKSVEYIENERRFLIDNLNRLGFKTYNSKANFVFFKGNDKIYNELLNKGILIRQCGSFRGLDDSFYRAAIRLHKDNEELIRELEEIR